MVARAHDPAALDRLRALADDIDRAVTSGDPVAASRADLAFHEGLCELCGNSRIHEVFMRYVPTLRGLLRLDEQVLRSLDEISSQHRPLVEAIEAGDEEGAATLLNEHAEHAGELIAGVLASND
jgi:DNA-binding GntR family transcriptional regulator